MINNFIRSTHDQIQQLISDIMTSVYQKYEIQLTHDISLVQERIKEKELSKKDFNQMRSLLSECQKNIKLIQTQLSSDPSPEKAKATFKLKQYRQTYNNLKKEIYNKENSIQFEKNKKQLLSTRPNSDEYIKGQDKTVQVNQRLRQSVKVMYENLQISENVTEQLQSQTGKLLNSKSKVVGIRDNLQKSERRIKSMMVRMRKNKMVVRVVIGIIILVFIIILVSYFK